MTTTSQIRNWWAPACKANKADLTPAYVALDKILHKHGYRPRSGVTGAFNCRKITGGTGYSLHAYDPNGFFHFWTGVRVTMALAVDINWDKNPYGKKLVTDMPKAMIDEIKKIRTGNGKQLWRWGGDYTNNKDAMHFEIIVSPADLSTGVVLPSTAKPKPTPTPTPKDDDMAKPLLFRLSAKDPAVLYMAPDRTVHWVKSPSALAGYKADMGLQGLSADVCVLNDKDLKDFKNFAINLPFLGDWPTINGKSTGVKEAWKGPHFKST